MTIRPLDLMEPEETVGTLWHDMASGFGAAAAFPEAAAALAALRPSLALLFRALSGDGAVDIAEAPATLSGHRLPVHRKIGTASESLHLPAFDGTRLRLPPVIDIFPEAGLNRAAYLWLTALAAFARPPDVAEGEARDRAALAANAAAADRAFAECPGLRQAHQEMCRHILATRRRPVLPPAEARIEQAIRDQLGGARCTTCPEPGPSRGYRTFLPVPIWLTFPADARSGAAEDQPSEGQAPAGLAVTSRKLGRREDRGEANRTDSFILHRFEAILSWVESMNLNRSVDDDDEDAAQKAAEDQEQITLSRHDRKAATRLRIHLDLSPADADHEALAAAHTYPEWNHRSRSYLDAHCRVLEAEAQPGGDGFTPDPHRMARVRRQFEALRLRRVMRPRQIEGQDLDLDAIIAAQADLAATGQGSDRIYQSQRQTDRDLSVAFLLDTSRSTEAAVGDARVIDVAREALAALAGGIDAAGDRLGIWGFSSLRRDRVFLHRAKAFDAPHGPQVTDRICGLAPGHYTRLGAAIRHVTMRLGEEGSARKLLLVLTDGKPNDLDHYEGIHGIEDSHMAVREARREGQTVHGIVVDADAQDWFARIFGRGGFTLLPEPGRLVRALPDIYRNLTTGDLA